MKHHDLTASGLLAALLCTGTLSLSGCGDGETVPADVGAEASAVVDTATLPGDIYIAGGDAVDTAPPPVIYYDLTRYDWYARGEPLVHEQGSYRSAGLVAAGGAEMEHVGEYGGVAFYRRRDDGADSLFVPVFERYWLVFTPQPADG